MRANPEGAERLRALMCNFPQTVIQGLGCLVWRFGAFIVLRSRRKRLGRHPHPCESGQLVQVRKRSFKPGHNSWLAYDSPRKSTVRASGPLF